MTIPATAPPEMPDDDDDDSSDKDTLTPGPFSTPMREFLAHDGPALLVVKTERQELTIPPSIEFEQAKGFALYAMRTVLDGKGTKLLDLAKANLRQLF